MNYLRKADLKRIVACAILFAAVQGMMFADIIGPFWELNIVLICINIILAVSLNLINDPSGLSGSEGLVIFNIMEGAYED